MDYLSLFTGAGGGDLAMQHLLGFRCRGYVEYEPYCQEVIKQRIADGLLDAAPIFGDIRAFVSEGYAESYQGMADVVTGGFPCQPFSVAGKQLGADDPRNMWPATIEAIRIVRPRYAFLENVPGLLTTRYFGRILGDLAESGFDARWKVVSAAEVGAPHKRDRLWILADSKCGGCGTERLAASMVGISGEWENNTMQAQESGVLPDTNQAGCGEQWRAKPVQEKHAYAECGSEKLADTERSLQHGRQQRPSWWAGEPLEALQDAREGRGEEAWLSIPESELGRVANGVAHRVDRLKALGNGQVSLVAATAFRILSGGLK